VTASTIFQRTIRKRVIGFFWSTAKGHHLGMFVNFGGPGMIPVPGDYDGDGYSDMAVYRSGPANWYIWDIVEATSMVWA